MTNDHDIVESNKHFGHEVNVQEFFTIPNRIMGFDVGVEEWFSISRKTIKAAGLFLILLSASACQETAALVESETPTETTPPTVQALRSDEAAALQAQIDKLSDSLEELNSSLTAQGDAINQLNEDLDAAVLDASISVTSARFWVYDADGIKRLPVASVSGASGSPFVILDNGLLAGIDHTHSGPTWIGTLPRYFLSTDCTGQAYISAGGRAAGWYYSVNEHSNVWGFGIAPDASTTVVEVNSTLASHGGGCDELSSQSRVAYALPATEIIPDSYKIKKPYTIRLAE